ncbi:MAG: hypothetical protein ACRCUZ_06885, partial [Shewanella sp.]
APSTPQLAAAPASPQANAPCHTVTRRDTLWSIANARARHAHVEPYAYLLALVAKNPHAFGRQLQIRANARLRCPSTAELDAFSLQPLPALRRQYASHLR